MRKFLLAIALCTAGLLTAQPSMTVSTAGNYQNPFWMAANVLVDSNLPVYDMPHVWSPTFTSQPNTSQIGYFQANDSTFPVQSGIVMVAAQNADAVIQAGPPGPAGFGNTITDSELGSVISALQTSGSLYDMVSIEFSFYAQSDSIAFNYCFGSFEYPGFTCTQYNDVFGFFLEGPYIDGVSAPTGGSIVKNIATIPGTNVPIAVNTINGGSPTGFGSASTCLSANPNYVAHSAFYNSSNNSVTTLPGYTDKFTASAKVQCGGWYTIRLKLANVLDNAYTSAVFLEENSLKGPEIAFSQNNNVGNSFTDSLLVEGCNKNEIIFSRSANLGVEMKIPIFVDTVLSTAVEGVDFSMLPDTITLDPYETADTLEFWIYDDNVAEANEALVIVQDYVFTECYNYPVHRFEYYLRDKDTLNGTLTVNAPTDTVDCPGDSVELITTSVTYEGSYDGFWLNDSAFVPSRWFQVDGDTTFTYIMFDECGDTMIFEQNMYLKPYEPMVYEQDTIRVCPGDSAWLSPVYYGGQDPLTFYWLDNLTQNNPRSILPWNDTTYVPFSVSDGCQVLLIDSALAINMPRPTAGFNYINDPYIPLRVTFDEKAQNEVSWTWYLDSTVITGESFEYDFSRPGEYEVTQVVTSDFGCIDSITLIVAVETDFYLYIPMAFSPNNDGVNDCYEIKGVGFEAIDFKVYDRWGNVVYASTDENDCWDGTFNGRALPTGAYSWKLLVRLPFDEIAMKEGILTILK
jgi:gliding motility-associated-like protein